LHAWTLQLQHPITQAVLKFEAPPPSELLIAQPSRHKL